MSTRDDLFRSRGEGGHEKAEVKSIELFFDLVFVFAVTQLSHLLIGQQSIVGALETGLLLMAVWWVWIYTSWATNWLDPDTVPVRLLVFLLMLAGLVLSASIPQAFGERGIAFAAALVIMQLGRNLFMLWALRPTNPGNYLNFQRITAWFALSAPFWIAGAFLESELRLIVWAVAMAIEFVAPSLGYRVPGLGRSSTKDWDISGHHIAERCGLFVIIALGESILVTGATWAKLEWSMETIAAFAISFVGSIAMWWVYFHIGAERARGVISASSNPGRAARLAYTYLHLLLVAGIIVAAVGDEIILKHPHGHTDLPTLSILLGGPALFLAGNLLFKWTTAARPPLSHLMGIALLAGLIPTQHAFPPLAIAAAANLVLVLVAVWEARSLGRFAEDGVIE